MLAYKSGTVEGYKVRESKRTAAVKKVERQAERQENLKDQILDRLENGRFLKYWGTNLSHRLLDAIDVIVRIEKTPGVIDVRFGDPRLPDEIWLWNTAAVQQRRMRSAAVQQRRMRSAAVQQRRMRSAAIPVAKAA